MKGNVQLQLISSSEVSVNLDICLVMIHFFECRGHLMWRLYMIVGKKMWKVL